MRQVFHKFLISEIPQKLKRHRNVWVGQVEFKKKLKKKKQTKTKLKKQTPFPNCRRQSYDLQSVGGNFRILPPTFGLDGRFPFYDAPRSFSIKKIFLVFTLHWLDRSLDQAGPCEILSNWSDSPATEVVTSSTISRSAEGLQEKGDGQTVKQRKLYGKWPQEGQRALVSLWAVQVVQVF